MSRLLIFGLGVLVGAGAATYGPELSANMRPLLKEAIKAALQLAHGARVQSAGLAEAFEDLYAEALAESRTASARRGTRRGAKARKQAVRRRTARAKPMAEPAAQHA
jgi:hypothetical protein